MKKKQTRWPANWESWAFIKMPHYPVLLKEAIEFLNLQKGSKVLDATVDGGGHAEEILNKIVPDGKLIGIDQDQQLLEDLNSKFQITKFKENIILINGNFRNLDKLLEPLKINFLDAAFFDLGISSLQLQNSGRGFSFQKDEPLIMTFKSRPGDLTAADILNKFPEEEIYRILKEYGEERYAGRIARAIVREREYRPFKTTAELMEAIRKAVPPQYKRGHISFATRTFQALRIAVNDELGALEEGLAKAWTLLGLKGRLVVISFHSLEDRIVKNFFKKKSMEGEGLILIKKPVTPSEEEIFLNPRSRSAKLRAIKKIGK